MNLRGLLGREMLVFSARAHARACASKVATGTPPGREYGGVVVKVFFFGAPILARLQLENKAMELRTEARRPDGPNEANGSREGGQM